MTILILKIGLLLISFVIILYVKQNVNKKESFVELMRTKSMAELKSYIYKSVKPQKADLHKISDFDAILNIDRSEFKIGLNNFTVFVQQVNIFNGDYLIKVAGKNYLYIIGLDITNSEYYVIAGGHKLDIQARNEITKMPSASMIAGISSGTSVVLRSHRPAMTEPAIAIMTSSSISKHSTAP